MVHLIQTLQTDFQILIDNYQKGNGVCMLKALDKILYGNFIGRRPKIQNNSWPFRAHTNNIKNYIHNYKTKNSKLIK